MAEIVVSPRATVLCNVGPNLIHKKHDVVLTGRINVKRARQYKYRCTTFTQV